MLGQGSHGVAACKLQGWARPVACQVGMLESAQACSKGIRQLLPATSPDFSPSSYFHSQKEGVHTCVVC